MGQENNPSSTSLRDHRSTPAATAEKSNGATTSSSSSHPQASSLSSNAIPQVQPAPPTSNHGVTIRHVTPTTVQSNIRMVPVLFQHCGMPDIIALVASMFDKLIRYNDTLPPSEKLTRFHSKAAPAITPSAYLSRITTFINVDPCILIILLYYIDRLSEYLSINSLTIHRFLISAICCGSKALSDSFATNSRYAKVGGVELVEMNALEREFLTALDWRLATSGTMLDQYWRSLVENHPGYGLLHQGSPPINSTLYINGSVAGSIGTAPDETSVSGENRPVKRAKAKENS